MKTDHGAATVAAPCHLGFRLLNPNLWPARRSYPGSPFAMSADLSRCRHGGGAVPSGVLSFRRESSPQTAALIDRRWREMTTVHGCATVAPPSHLEFYRMPENQVVDATVLAFYDLPSILRRRLSVCNRSSRDSGKTLTVIPHWTPSRLSPTGAPCSDVLSSVPPGPRGSVPSRPPRQAK
jgi:hypothetical protein